MHKVKSPEHQAVAGAVSPGDPTGAESVPTAVLQARPVSSGTWQLRPRLTWRPVQSGRLSHVLTEERQSLTESRQFLPRCLDVTVNDVGMQQNTQ